MPRKVTWLVLLPVLLVPSPAKSFPSPCAGTDLFVPGTIPADSGVTQVFSGRLDSDAENDLVLVRGGLGSFEIRLHAESSPATPGASYTWGTPILRATLADLDADGHLDLAFTDDASRVVIFRGAADGTFSLGNILTLSAPGFDLAAASISTTPGLEIVVTHPTAGKLTTWMWTSGPFNYSPVETSISTYAADPQFLVVGRLNADGLQDVLLTRRANTRIWLFRGTGSGSNGDGHFAASSSWLMPSPPTSLRLADLDFDGHLDIVCGTPTAVLWEFGHGDGRFDGGSSVPLSSAAVSDIAVADANVDSLPDILCTRINPNVVTHIASSGLRTFTKLADFSVAGAPGGLAELPLGGSGGHDFVAGLRDSVGLASLISQCIVVPDTIPMFDPRPIAPPIGEPAPLPGPNPVAYPYGPPPPLPDPGPTPAVDPWPENGAVICDAPGEQGNLKGADDFAHGAYFAWVDLRSGSRDIYAVRLGPDGVPAPGWIPNGTPVCTAPGEQFSVSCFTDDTLGVWVTWMDERDPDRAFYAQRMTADGGIAPGWPVNGRKLAPSPALTAYVATPDHLGGILYWWKETSGGVTSLFGHHIRSDGLPAPGWGTTGALGYQSYQASYRCADVWQEFTGVAAAWPDGFRFAYVWGQNCTGLPDCHGCLSQLENGLGWIGPNAATLLASPNTNGTLSAGGQEIASTYCSQAWLLDEGNGGFLAMDLCYRIFRYGAYGRPSWVAWLYDPFDITPDGGGNFDVMTWGTPIPLARKLMNDGTWSPAFGPDGIPVCESPGLVSSGPARVADGSGGIFALWRDERSDPGNPEASDLYVTLIRGDGTRAPGWRPDGDPITSLPGNEQPALLLGDRRGAAIAAWRDRRAGDWNLYAYRLDGVAPSLARDARHPLEPFRFEETRSPELAIRGVRAGASGGALVVDLSLPRSAHARLRALDVAGRLVASLDLSGFGAGVRTVTMGGTAGFAPGVYLIELSADGRRVHRKAVIWR